MDPIETWHDAPEFERMEAKIKALEAKLDAANKEIALQKQRVEDWKKDYDSISNQLNIVQNERANSFAMLQQTIGKCGLTSFQPEADLEINARIEQIKFELNDAKAKLAALVEADEIVATENYDCADAYFKAMKELRAAAAAAKVNP